MSLLRIRRERKEQSIGPWRPPRLGKLLVGLILVILAIWYLSGLG
jgi:hypothetical protein